MVDQAQVIASLDRALTTTRRALTTALDRYDLPAVRPGTPAQIGPHCGA